MSSARVSIITNLHLRINKHKRENDKQKCLLMIFLSLFLKVLLKTCCCSITNTVTSLVPHKLHQIHMNNQQKFMTWSSKLKVHRENSQTMLSYPYGLSTNILFSSLASFGICLLVFLCFLFCGRVSEKQIFSRLTSGNNFQESFPVFFLFFVLFLFFCLSYNIANWTFDKFSEMMEILIL